VAYAREYSDGIYPFSGMVFSIGTGHFYFFIFFCPHFFLLIGFEKFSVLVPPKPRNGVRDKLRGGGRKRISLLFWIFFEKSSDFVQNTELGA